MPYKRLIGQAGEMWEVPRDLLLGRYPEFITGGPLPQGHVPVFCFHGAEPESFTRKLQYLSDNGYATLSASEYFQHLMGTRHVPQRSVVLTFDDGRCSVRTVAEPLMRRYGMKAVVFLIPARMVSRPGPLPPTRDDASGKRDATVNVLDREKGDDPFLTWEEVDALAQTGLFDFQSHTLSHGRVHTGPQVVDFMHPALRRGFAPLDVPLIRDDGGDLLGPRVPLGAPLFRSAPRASEALRYFEDPDVRAACVRAVAAEGGDVFFTKNGWRRSLKALLNGRSLGGRYETPEERAMAIRDELRLAKSLIEERTGQEVVHLCYPWHVAGPTARRIARETGHRTSFCGKVPGVPITLPGGDLQAIARIGEDYVELLPGRGRGNLGSILKMKWQRRVAAAAHHVGRER